MELPSGQLLLDLHPVPAGGGEAGGQTLRPPSHLLRLGQSLLGQPPAVAGLQRFGQPAQVPERQWWDAGADGQPSGAVGPGQLEGAQTLEGPPEG